MEIIINDRFYEDRNDAIIEKCIKELIPREIARGRRNLILPVPEAKGS